jgi:hypothetical protein
VFKPTIGQRIYEGAVGSAGVLCESCGYLKKTPKLTTRDVKKLQERTFYGKEKKSLAYVIAIMNMILHGTCTFRLEIEDVYKRRGGILPILPLNLRSWDVESDGIAIEFDEYLHLNRYRGMTLQSAIYKRLPRFPLNAYKRYCSEHEEKCLCAGSYGGNWTNKSARAQFGLESPPRDMSERWISRWKQREFYDFLKDLSPLLIGVNVVRVAVWGLLIAGDHTTTVGNALTALTQLR